MIISNDKYHMTEINNSYYSVQMKLIIRRIHKSDLGGYKCISKNSIGDAEGNIRLYGKPKLHLLSDLQLSNYEMLMSLTLELVTQ